MKKLFRLYMRVPFHKRLQHIIIALLSILMFIMLITSVISFKNFDSLSDLFDLELLAFIAAGIVAQLIDGALGMAYGISCTSLLLGLNVAPAVASASVHVSEVFTAGASGISHLKFKNIQKGLFFRIVFFGVIGGVAGAWLLSDYVNGDYIKPFISAYLFILGIVIFVRAFKKYEKPKHVKRVGLLALFGGFMDSVGGGGWGPIVTTNLIHKGANPRRTIGTVNIAEFFVALFSSGVFIVLVGVTSVKTIVGLVIGGVIAAPFAAYIVKKVQYKYMLIVVGVLIMIISIINLTKSWKVIPELWQMFF